MALNTSSGLLAFLPGMPGWAEILVILFIGLLLFGKRLPDVARSLGTSIVEFKKGMRDMKTDIDQAGNDRDRRMEGSSAAPLPRSSEPPSSTSEEPAKSSANTSE